MKLRLKGFLTLILLGMCIFFCSCGKSNIETLAIVVTDTDIDRLEKYTSLKNLDLTGSTCYESIANYISAHPGVDVKFNIDVAGNIISNKAENIEYYLSDPDPLTACADYFKNLNSIDLGLTSMNAQQIRELRSAFPNAELIYTVEILGEEVPMNITELTLCEINSDNLQALAQQLEKLPNLEYIDLLDKDGKANLNKEAFLLLAASCPDASFNYKFELFGQECSTLDEQIIYKVVEIGNDGVQQIREILPYMHKLTYLRLDRCGIDNETMAQLRDDFPEIKVVWRVDFGIFSVLTDVEKIWAYCDMRDEYSHILNYCTDVKYIDIGHSPVSDISFCYYMPKLEVAIFALTGVKDLTPLGSCPNLEYLEFSTTPVEDVSPLANCKNLEHVNMGDTLVTDISPLFNLTKLKRFYCQNNWLHLPEEQMEKFIELHPDCETRFDWSGEYGPLQYDWRYGAPLVDGWQERYGLIRQQFGYDGGLGLSTLYNDPEQ